MDWNLLFNWFFNVTLVFIKFAHTDFINYFQFFFPMLKVNYSELIYLIETYRGWKIDYLYSIMYFIKLAVLVCFIVCFLISSCSFFRDAKFSSTPVFELVKYISFIHGYTHDDSFRNFPSRIVHPVIFVTRRARNNFYLSVSIKPEIIQNRYKWKQTFDI